MDLKVIHFKYGIFYSSLHIFIFPMAIPILASIVQICLLLICFLSANKIMWKLLLQLLNQCR
ncbi:unnamed protein product [Meloidogyne enterolobii]|uniref:Uncharacterized protein n=1 Tax=Meloidogyne enterolobii TaxID=390850 RepID=A0ACB0YX55_MELEN